MPVPYSDNLYSADLDDEYDDDDDEVLNHNISNDNDNSNNNTNEEEALSPTDGYFHASSASLDEASSYHHRTCSVPHVPNILVEDPSLPNDNSKAREVERERRLNNDAQSLTPTASFPASSQQDHHQQQQQQQQQQSNRSSPHQTSHSHHHNTSSSSPLTRNPVNLRTPLFSPRPQSEAPPAYTPSPSSPHSPPHSSTSYQTFAAAATMGRPEEHRHLLPRGPESMSGASPNNAGNGSSSFASATATAWQRIKGAVHELNLRKRIRSALGVLVILSIFLMVFSSFTLRPSHEDPDRESKPPSPSKPGKEPFMGDDGDIKWSPRGMCRDSPHRMAKREQMLDFYSGHNLTIIQEVEEHDGDGRGSGWMPRVSGDLLLRPVSASSPGRVDIEVISNHEDLDVNVDFDQATQLLRVTTPYKVDYWRNGQQAPCIRIRITLWAPQESTLDALRVSLTHLDFRILSGLALSTVKGTTVHTIIGDVQTSKPSEDDNLKPPYHLSSREIYIETKSGHVNGWFPLYDILSIKTTSGDVTADIAPKRASTQDPKPARLSVTSVSGTVRVKEPLDGALAAENPSKAFPSRDYIFEVDTTSGSVHADVAVGTYTRLHSQSGDFKVKLWPILDSNLLRFAGSKPSIQTDTMSGDQDVVILEPVWTSIPLQAQRDHGNDIFTMLDTPALSSLKSKHESVSGTIKLAYPVSWEGSLWAETISGSQKIRGEGLEVHHSGSPIIHHINAKKGHGFSSLNIKTVSGSQNVLIGNEP